MLAGSSDRILLSPWRERYEMLDSLVPSDIKGLTKKQLKGLKEGKSSPVHLIENWKEQNYRSIAQG